MTPRTLFSFFVALASLALAAPANAEPDPRLEFLRLDRFIVPTRSESGELWAFTPNGAAVVENQKVKSRFTDGSGYLGRPATFASTSKGWILGTTEGAWEIRLNDSDLRPLPELEAEGVYRFEGNLAFTSGSVYRLERPWERHAFAGFSFEDLGDVLPRGDTLYVATRKGLRRLLWDERRWDDAPFGKRAEKEHVVRFFPASVQNRIDAPDSLEVKTPALLAGERRIFYEERKSHEWIPIEGIDLPGFRRASSDSAYRRIPRLIFQDLDPVSGTDRLWRRWVVTPTGVTRLELPHGDVPYQTSTFALDGDVRGTYLDSVFVWVGTTRELHVIDREFHNVDAFIDEGETFVWGFLGVPSEFTIDVSAEERGWYALTSEGITEVFSGSWSWDAYGFDQFRVEDLLSFAGDVDGFWVGTSRGLRWFSAAKREWEPLRVPASLRSTPVYKLEWYGSDLYAMTGKGVYSSTRHSLPWRQVAPFP